MVCVSSGRENVSRERHSRRRVTYLYVSVGARRTEHPEAFASWVTAATAKEQRSEPSAGFLKSTDNLTSSSSLRDESSCLVYVEITYNYMEKWNDIVRGAGRL